MKKTICCAVLLLLAVVTVRSEGREQAVPVILTAGQSNTDGRVLNEDLPEEIRRTGYQYCQWSFGSGYHSGKGQFERFYPRINHKETPGKWAYDAVVYHRLEQLLQKPFYVIKESLGGTAIDTTCRSTHQMYWSADAGWLSRNRAADKGGKSLLKAFTENIGACIDNRLKTLPEGYDIKCLLWHQGESDFRQAGRFEQNLQEVVSYLRNYLVEKTGEQKYARLPVFCGTFSHKSRNYVPELEQALFRLAAQDPDFHVVDVGDATLQADQIHFDAAGATLLGNRMFDLMVAAKVVEDESFAWYDGSSPVRYAMRGAPTPVVKTALDMLDEDLHDVTGTGLQKTAATQATIRIVQLDRDKGARRELAAAGVPVDSLTTKKDAFCLKVAKGTLWVVGSDERGTAYGILELSRLAGVSPWKWWADEQPMRRNRLAVSKDYETLQSPSVAYRGIFLNDEDWTLQPWSWRTYSPGKPGLISAKTYKQIFQLLMRLRANAIWPGMHGMTAPFFTVPGAKEAADSCGIAIGTSHCEPMMRNNVGEWDKAERGAYNYITNKEGVQQYWIERLKETGRYENIYTIGMRGIHDSGMEGVGKGLDEQTAALQQVIDDQRELLRRHVDKRVERIPQQFVPYKEVLQVMENGLQLPDDVTLTWCDDNYGYMTRLSDSLQQRRSGGAGVYYHLSYWGRPHDYMWLSTTQPGLVYNEMREAYDHHVRKLWIVNVHDMKTAAYDLELFLDIAWNINCVSPSTLYQHQEQWLCREFGAEAGRRLLPVMQEFYRLTAIRKPEFMGWNQVELDKRVYDRGWSPVADTAFSLTEFGGELDRYLADWEKVTAALRDVERTIPAERQDAFFSHIKYPVLGAAAMSRKMLEAQRARSIAQANYDPERWQRDTLLYAACAKSQDAYQEIRRLTNYYNKELANGKWKHSMVDNPRDLYVFYAPTLPVSLTEREVAVYKNTPTAAVRSVGGCLDSCVVRNACQYDEARVGVRSIQSLGHSMAAVSLPKGQSVSYAFDWQGGTEALLRIALIPTQPNDKGDLRFSVSIDGGAPQVFSLKEGFRTERWKQNVLRGQAVRTLPVTLSPGSHHLTITALDPHVVLDQWMLDTNRERQFYVFPIAPSY